MFVPTREMILALRESAEDPALRHACDEVLWNVDGNGELHGFHTASGDLVRAAIMARVRTPLKYAHVIEMVRYPNGWVQREAQIWNSWSICIIAHDPFQNGAHTRYAPNDVATEIARWRAQNGR